MENIPYLGNMTLHVVSPDLAVLEFFPKAHPLIGLTTRVNVALAGECYIFSSGNEAMEYASSTRPGGEYDGLRFVSLDGRVDGKLRNKEIVKYDRWQTPDDLHLLLLRIATHIDSKKVAIQHIHYGWREGGQKIELSFKPPQKLNEKRLAKKVAAWWNAILLD